ncbi:hypothetical protein C8R47DRAFT_919096, partial [Mycena vitilis]
QLEAQAKIQSVTGANLNDESSLPYAPAVLWEVLRWQNATPLGMYEIRPENTKRLIEHSSLCSGRFSRSPRTCPDPYAFEPEPFFADGRLNPAVQKPEAAFSFGRR